MNFAGKKLNNYYKDPRKLSSRERKLVAENTRLKKRNRRLSGAMVYLVGQVEKRLPFFSDNSSTQTASTPPQPLQKPTPRPAANPAPRKSPQKQKIVGEAWEPEKLTSNQAAQAAKRKRKPLNEILETTSYKVDISEVSFHQEAEKRVPLYERVQHETEQEIEAATPDAVAEEAGIEAKPQDTDNSLQEEAAGIEHTPELDPDEMNLLASPTWDKKQDVFHPQPSELITERSPKATSAQEASDAYKAVAVSSQPVPETPVSTEPDDADAADEDALLADQLAQQQDVMRAAMLRRVNRLRW